MRGAFVYATSISLLLKIRLHEARRSHPIRRLSSAYEFSVEPETVDGLSIPATAKLAEAVCPGTVMLGFMGAWAVGVGVELDPLSPSPQPPTIKPQASTSARKGYVCMPGMSPSRLRRD